MDNLVFVNTLIFSSLNEQLREAYIKDMLSSRFMFDKTFNSIMENVFENEIEMTEELSSNIAAEVDAFLTGEKEDICFSIRNTDFNVNMIEFDTESGFISLEVVDG